jgi:type IV secretion system protein VirB9
MVALFCAAVPAAAQYALQPNPRIRVIEYFPDALFRIEAEQGYLVTLQLGADERIENVAVGDSTAWQVSANNRGDLVFIKPVRAGIATNMTIATDARIYLFELVPSSGRGMSAPYMVRFSFPATPETPAGAKPAGIVGHYRLTGSRSLRPSWMGDDGQKTFIEWPADVALPAVFTIDPQGREALVNGNMRDGRYVIDSVLPKLIFRIDDASANAVRLAAKAP